MNHPQTRVEQVQDTLAGVSLPDPYRWLETESEEVQAWQRAQAALASGYTREWPHFDRVKGLVERFEIERRVSLPRYAAGRWFRTQVQRGSAQAQALVASEPFGEGHVLFDPGQENGQRPPFLSWISPSPDGRLLALGVCPDGSESNTIRIVDVETGRLLSGAPTHTLMDNWTGGAHWLPDSSGFFFCALVGPAIDCDQRVYLHLLSSALRPKPTTLPLDIAWTEQKDWRMVVVSRDGQYALALERLIRPIPVAVARLGTQPLQWRPFVTSVAGTLAGHVVGERYIAVTDVGAARGRLVAIPFNADDPDDPRCWHELVAESDAVLRTVTPIGDALYLSELVDTYARVRIVDLAGSTLGTVPLPGKGALSELGGALMNLVPPPQPARFMFGFSSLTASPGIYSHASHERQLEILQEPRARLDEAIVEDRWAVSADGTRIPYHIVRNANVSTELPQPTLIYAYGGYNVPLVPQFPGAMAAFVAAGGVFVHAHLRGGGELGLEWWRAGRLDKKQNCFDDLYAIAEDLIASDRAAPQLLAVTGGSNGGLTAGVAATQRPELWAAVVPRVPVLDLIGACRNPYGRMATLMERANVDDPDEVRRLARFSPYHLVKEGIRYPAVFLDAGDTDSRCPPWHARKFAARMQAASVSGAPILLHVWENVGHGWATDRRIAVLEHAEWIAFVLRVLGVELPDE